MLSAEIDYFTNEEGHEANQQRKKDESQAEIDVVDELRVETSPLDAVVGVWVMERPHIFAVEQIESAARVGKRRQRRKQGRYFGNSD